MTDTIYGLDKIGLHPRDGRVYVALLKNGLCSIRKIADVTNINRGSVYESIKGLQAVGLVSFQQNNVNKKYFAEDPSRILDLIKQRQSELDEVERSAQQVVPSLLNASAYLPYANIKFYEDHDGVATILRDVLDTASKTPQKEYYAISSKPMRQYIYKKFPNFTAKRIKQGLFVKVIALGEGGEEARASERKWLTGFSETEPSSYTLIYGDKLAIIALNHAMHPYGIVIEDSGVAGAQRLLFNQIWNAS